ncbi:ggdef domain protein [Luminiphilus syltensis NOR5-1B]|uniref:diguanylate cyclase n=1 Tax=Luminiphilus syltensis NOR5-1B TaxID=565045 RepID=B8KWS7_9GAMM|nr:GGDEF domain-containing protein [Luminiphilus syltensis]EED36281.1 ggdef domain protein [Luminiphilus syltensis NOR5-1B]
MSNNNGFAAGPFRFARLFMRPQGIFLIAAFFMMPLVSGYSLLTSSKQQLDEELSLLCREVVSTFTAESYLEFVSDPSRTALARYDFMEKLGIIHKSNPKIEYIYTLRGSGDNWYFLLDTLQDPNTYAAVSQRSPSAVASNWLEPYEYPDDFLMSIEVLKQGEVWVDPAIFTDDYGSTVGCMIPIYQDKDVMHVLGLDYRADQLQALKKPVVLAIGYGGVVGLILLLVSQYYLRSYLSIKEKLLEQLKITSTTDTLTGIANRNALFESARALIQQRQPGTFLAAAIIDLDLFKNINDTYGHQAGDETLIVFARLLDEYCNARKFVVGRIGGEEFGVVCVTRNRDDMLNTLSSLKAALKKVTISSGEQTFDVTFSAGYAVSTDKEELHELMKLADFALYESKDSGRNRITLYHPEVVPEI